MIDSGRIRTPVSIAESPSAIERNSGTAKNRPACSRYWKKNDGEPAAQQPDPQDRRVEQRGLTGVAAVLLPGEEPEQHRAAAEDAARSPATAPATSARPASGCTNPQVPDAQDPVHDQTEAERRERGADEVEAGALLLRRVGRAPVEQQHHADDEHLADEHVAPRPVRGEQAADERTDRDRDRAADGDDPVRPSAARPCRSSTPPAPRSPASPAPRRRLRGTTSRTSAPRGWARSRSSTIRTRRSRSRS